MQETIGHPATPDLTAAEKALCDAVAAGETARLGGAVLRADILRDVIFQRGGLAKVQSFGVRIADAEIKGALKLDGCSFNFPVAFSNVSFAADDGHPALTLRDAHVRRLALHRVRLSGPLHAERATIDNGFVAEEVECAGEISFSGARVGHALSLINSKVGAAGKALVAPGLHVAGAISLRATEFSGAVDLGRTRLEDGLFADDARIIVTATDEQQTQRSPSQHQLITKLVLDLEGASLAGDLRLAGAVIDSGVTMENARIGGRLEAVDAVVGAANGTWEMSGISVAHSLCLDGATIKGDVRLIGAEIGKSLLANGTTIEGGETAISADLIKVDGNLEATQAKFVGQLRCPGAVIRGQLRLTGTKLYGSELALRGDGCSIGGGCYLSRAFIVGLVRFPGARIANQFRLRGATIKVEHGPALLASGAQFARDIELGGGFETIGGIVLDQAEINGSCDLRGSHLKSSAGVRVAATSPMKRPARGDEAFDQLVLSLVDARITRLQMPAHGDERPRGIVDLSRARISAYEDWANTWPPETKKRGTDADGSDIDHLVLDGLVYDHLVNPAGVGEEHHSRDQDRAGERRLTWLRGQHSRDVTEHFRPQPWVQLAGRLAGQGMAGDARKIAIERRRRERRSHAATAVMRWESRFLDWVALFGFNPWRTVLWSILAIVMFAGFWSWAASDCGQRGCLDQKVFVASNVDAYGSAKIEDVYPPFNAMGYAVDNFIPVISLGYADHWRPNVRYKPLMDISVPNVPLFLTGETRKDRLYANIWLTTGGIFYTVSLIQQLIGLILLSLAATGFAGILREET